MHHIVLRNDFKRIVNKSLQIASMLYVQQTSETISDFERSNDRQRQRHNISSEQETKKKEWKCEILRYVEYKLLNGQWFCVELRGSRFEYDVSFACHPPAHNIRIQFDARRKNRERERE